MNEFNKGHSNTNAYFGGLNIALLLVMISWAIERVVFAAKYISPTLADYFVMLFVGIVGLVATIVSYRWYKRTPVSVVLAKDNQVR